MEEGDDQQTWGPLKSVIESLGVEDKDMVEYLLVMVKDNKESMEDEEGKDDFKESMEEQISGLVGADDGALDFTDFWPEVELCLASSEESAKAAQAEAAVTAAREAAARLAALEAESKAATEAFEAEAAATIPESKEDIRARRAIVEAVEGGFEVDEHGDIVYEATGANASSGKKAAGDGGAWAAVTNGNRATVANEQAAQRAANKKAHLEKVAKDKEMTERAKAKKDKEARRTTRNERRRM